MEIVNIELLNAFQTKTNLGTLQLLIGATIGLIHETMDIRVSENGESPDLSWGNRRGHDEQRTEAQRGQRGGI